MITRGLRSLQLLPLILAVAALAIFASHSSAQIPGFVPGFNACSSTAPVDTTPGATSNIKGVFGVGLGADCQKGTGDDETSFLSAGLVGVTPPEWGVAESADIPIGTKIGSFASLAQLGLLNNPCSTIIPVPFDMLNASIDTTDTIAPKPNLPNGKSAPNRLEPLGLDGNTNGIPDGAEKWPTYLNDEAADPDGAPWDLSKLRARYVGFNGTAVSGTMVVLNFLLFEPGAPVSKLFNVDPLLGYPSVTVLQDPTTVASDQDPVGDFCAPLAVNSEIFGEAGGGEFRKNPGDGTYNFITLVGNVPDADGDGIENSLDTCPTIANPTWDPRAPAPGPGDQDGDGLPDDADGCDPFPTERSAGTAGTGISFTDEDGDKWQNRGDNCPLVANEDQLDQDNGTGDAIGDACDPDPTTVNGAYAVNCMISEVVIGAGGAAAANPADLQPCNPSAPLSNAGGGDTGGGDTGGGDTGGGTTGGGTTGGGTTGGTGGGGVGGTGTTGIGSLSPVGTSPAAWAALLTAFGVIGVLGGAGLVGRRLWRKR